ncbi:MAG: class I SAM-dependent methyltransferase [Planctomycetota bacterium]|jgi:SAM-dependent methyltransferase
MSEWFEDLDFWDTMRPFMFEASRWESAADQVDAVVELLGIEEGARVLDLCSGPGRHSVELARRGFRVTAVDLNPAYLKELQSRSDAIETVESDMREFKRDNEFDIALNLFTSFGYFEDPADDLRVLENLQASLKAGGKLILDLNGKESLARKYQPRHWEQYEDGSILLIETKIHDGWSGASMTWTLIRGAERKGFTLYTRLYSGTEMIRIMQKAGFTEVKLHGWFDGSPYDHEAKRLVAVATA